MPDIQQILSTLTLKEKCALCSGVTNWKTTPIKDKGIPCVMMTDGPHGLRKEIQLQDVANVMQTSQESTCFPTAVTVASAWNVELAKEMGKAIAEEAKDQGVSTVLGPGINIKRNPLCGRNFEYFSEDPYLAGEMGANYVDGVQGEDIGTSLKHYAVNSQEYRRMTVSSEVDERALREIYLSGFENTVKKAQPYTIMCSYNPINGLHASDNKKILTDILRDEWGYEGIVMSDWGAVNDRVKGIKAGLDLEMPTSNGLRDKEIEDAVNSGELSEADLDIVVARMLRYIFRCHENMQKAKGYKADYQAHYDLARKIASEGAVLMANDGVLPLDKSAKIAVVGTLAKTMRYQGSGSSRINPIKLTSFTDYLDELKAPYEYCDGYVSDSDKPNSKLIKEAVEKAKDKDVVLVFAGLTDEYESEGFDRTHLDMPAAHNALIDALVEANKRVVVVLSGGSPVKMPWLSKVSAVLNMYLGGEAGGAACYDLIYGDVNPSGKLAETYPLSLRDNPAYLYYQMGPQTVEYRESIFVGYRYFDSAKKDVLFPFGYGMSYTKFDYSDIKLDKEEMDENDILKVTFKVRNSGTRDGKEIAQVYIKDVVSDVYKAEKELKGFVKVMLKAGEEKEVTVTLDRRSFAYYNVAANDWTVDGGEYEILAGASSRDIRISAKVNVKAKESPLPYAKEALASYYNIEHALDFPNKEFETLLGRELRENVKLRKGEIDENSVLEDLEFCAVGKVMRWAVNTFCPLVLPKDSPKFLIKMIKVSALSMPLRNMYAMTNGMVPKKAIEGIITRCNKGPFHGWGTVIGAFMHNKGVKKDQIYKPE